jgi:hypothetical protein
MNPLKGINQDISPNELPDGFYSFAKNVLLTSTFDSIENEKGFTSSNINSNGDYKVLYNLGLRPIGVVSTTKFEVFWLTNGTRSVVGTYNENADTFTVVYDDSTKPKLNLDLLHPIKAVWRENFLGEIYIAWTDRLNKPRILNIQKANLVNNDKDTLLFPEFIQPTIDFEIQEGGSLVAGTYYGYIQYETNDGKITDYSLATYPIYIGPDPQSAGVFGFFGSSSLATSKNIIFKISDVDQAYDKINFAVQAINKGNNVKEFVKVTTVNISGRTYIEIPYSGIEQTTTLTSDDVLIKAPSYTVAETITTLNSQLFLGSLSSEADLNIQKYVNNWKVNWIYDELVYPNLGELPKYSESKSFAHDEVYALYAVILFKSGKTSQAFTIPGRAVRTVTVGSKVFNENAIIKSTDNLPTEVGYTGDTDFLTEDDSLNTGNVKYFQTRDTCSWNGTVGTMGYWENQSEQYPNNSDYEIWDATGQIGTLAGQTVRHHKFPSNSFIKDTIYSADTAYGLTKIDKLGIKLADVYLPDSILAKVDKIIVCQAKRDFNNSLVVCQDKTSFMGFILNQVDAAPTDGVFSDSVNRADQWGTLPVLGTLNYSFQLSGNDQIRSFTPINQGEPYFPANTDPNFYRLKLHSPEILLSQPGLGSSYLKLNYKVSKVASSVWVGLDANNIRSSFVASTIDVTSGLAGTSSSVTNSKKIIKVLNYRYDIANQPNYPINNNPHTDCLGFSENGAVININKKFGLDNVGDNLSLNQEFNAGFVGFVPFVLRTPLTISDSFYSYTLLKYYSNVYNSFLDQDLLTIDKFEYDDRNTKTIYNSDVFLDLYSYNSFTGFPPGGADSGQIFVTDNNSVRTNHVHFIETSANSGMRKDDGFGTRFNKGTTTYLTEDNLLTGGNYVSINPDYNQVNEELSSVVFEDSTKSTDSFPHRIIKSLPITSESKIQQWTQFLPLDYYEIDKSKGMITNLQGVVDRLLIHTERALFITRDKARLGTDIAEVNLTSGELFDFAPIEIQPTTNGYTGTQHMFSCQLLNEGYFWVDAKSGKVFLYDLNSLNEVSKIGLYNFFAENLGTFNDSPFNSSGVTVTNDLRFNRVLVTVKKDTGSYTLSFSKGLDSGPAWVSFHDYIPDYLFSSRKNLFSFNNGKLYKHNTDLTRGTFYDEEKFSSYVDVTANPQSVISTGANGKRVYNDSSIYLNSIVWHTDFNDSAGVFDPEKTISHLTVRNQYQHSSRIVLDYSQLSIVTDTNSRNAESKWYCNSFRDLVVNKRLPFIQDIFNNFDEISSNIDSNKPWFEQEQFNNKWFIIRLEYDNEGDYKMVLHSVDINKSNSYR